MGPKLTKAAEIATVLGFLIVVWQAILKGSSSLAMPGLPAPLVSVVFVLLFFAMFSGLRELRRLGHRFEASAAPSAPKTPSQLRVLSRSPAGATVLLGEWEHDLGPGALEYFEGRSLQDQDMLLRLFRRNFVPRARFQKADLVVVVDPARRWHIESDRLLGRGRALVEQIEAELEERRRNQLIAEQSPPSPPSIASSLARAMAGDIMAGLPDFKFQQLGDSVQTWQDEVCSFLRKERPGHIEEFRRPISPPAGAPSQLEALLKKVNDLIERFVHIKRSGPQ